jgi:hypothetical protein
MSQPEGKTDIFHFLEKYLFPIVKNRRNLKPDGIGTNIDGCEFQGKLISCKITPCDLPFDIINHFLCTAYSERPRERAL